MSNGYSISYEADVIEYFDVKAKEYNLVENQVYWRLSDKLLWNTLNDRVLSKLRDDFEFVDAGGGTGRWTIKILQAYPKARGVIYDLSKSMTDEALTTAQVAGVADRLEIKNGRLENVASDLKTGFDLVFNFHNVLGFVQEPISVVKQLYSLLRSDGVLVSFVPNIYHAAFFNIMIGSVDQAKHVVESGRGRFTDVMPEMSFFSPSSISRLYVDTGLNIDLLTGFPCLIYPGFQETQLRGSTGSLENVLGSKENFDSIYKLESEVSKSPDIAARGNNIFIVGRKTL